LVERKLNKVSKVLYEFFTNFFHIIVGYISVKIGVPGLIIACIFLTYEYLTSKNKVELFSDYFEFLVGILIALYR
jgi:hypothetical protein